MTPTYGRMKRLRKRLSRLFHDDRISEQTPLETVRSARPADRVAALNVLGLSGDAGLFESLTLSGGRQLGDSMQLVPVPQADDQGNVLGDFLAHGVRYMSQEDRSGSVSCTAAIH